MPDESPEIYGQTINHSYAGLPKKKSLPMEFFGKLLINAFQQDIAGMSKKPVFVIIVLVGEAQLFVIATFR